VPCSADRLANLRSLCETHDKQIKEAPSGKRGRGGRPVIKGCDTDGWPFFSREPQDYARPISGARRAAASAVEAPRDAPDALLGREPQGSNPDEDKQR